MKELDKLVQLTYNKIFVENLHILKSDLDSIKKMILDHQKLLSNKLDKVLFISDLAEKIKFEKIDEASRQERTYGKVLMSDYKEIEILYIWLEAGIAEEQIVEGITIDEEDLKRLSNYLQTKGFINNATDFTDLMLNRTKHKVDWLKTKTLLIYLFEELKKEHLSEGFPVNSFIESNFSMKSAPIENVKQSKDGMNKTKNSKPKHHNLIDDFFTKNTLL